MYKKMNIAVTATAMVLAATLAVNCGGKKKGTISAKGKQLMGKTWKYDAEASQTASLTKAGKASGIKNLKDIKLKGDVKKIAGMFTAETLFFAKDKKKGTLAYVQTKGKSLLKSKRTGWVKWSDNQNTINLAAWKKGQKDLVYTVKELTANKLVLVSKANGAIKVYTR